jgi:hypothetical protein
VAPRAKKEKPAPGPDDLVRETAGLYRSGDGRFEVQKSDAGWYLVDTQQANEFGQQLMHGPLATLDAIRGALPGARDVTPLLRNRTAAGRKAGSRTARAAAGEAARSKVAPNQPPPPPKSWLDELPDKDGEHARRLIRVLEKEGIPDAEGLVRRFRDEPRTLATRIVEQRLRALIDERPHADRESAQYLVRRAAEILADEGMAVPNPAPRWALVSLKADDAQPESRIRPKL